ncbi:SdrD B-like domain-containing protein [Amycolatopsis samaneae]|uniref:SdrD B-like domain-containing protein n=1 Tax=Amycolatopsis samaneae TaxID=664691 RepID=A0ABW5GHG1_9PSEU
MFGNAPATDATAAPAEDGTLTVQVLRDFFGTGVINTPMDTPQEGMAVDVVDPAGHRLHGRTDVTGKVVVRDPGELRGGQYRVDVSIPERYRPYLQAAPASTAKNHFDSFTTFVDLRGGKNVSVVTAVWNPAEYALPDARFYVPVQSPAVNTDGSRPDLANSRALVAVDPALRGTCPKDSDCPAVVNTQAQVGTTWGVAYDRHRGRVFQAAFAKRYTEYGPGGGGAIYTTPVSGSGVPRLFATVPDTTETEHGAVDMRKDPHFIDVPGKESVGGIALTEDGKTLYAVNLRTRELVSFDATGATAKVTESVPIPDPGCADPGDWRPFGLAAHDAKLYVGGVCSAESGRRRQDLKVVVSTYDGESFTPVLEHGLDFPRGYVIGGITDPDTSHWNPWSADLSTWDKYVKYGPAINPQPELASMAFTRDGSMILGFRDRFTDIVGQGIDPREGHNELNGGMSGGDITMACAVPGGGYAWEGTGKCPNHGTPATNGHEPPGVVEYFHGDFFDPNRSGNGLHQEAAQGSVAYNPQQQWVVSTQLDPAQNVSSDGVGYYDVTSGIGPGHENPKHGYQFVDPANSFGKAGGLGDLAYQAANAPIQIGNLVWFDGDHNGIQDPNRTDEVPLKDATVSLLNAEGKRVASTRTDAAGEYYFGGVGAKYQLTRDAKYTVQFDVCTANTDNVPGTPPATDLRFTLPTAGPDRAHDSNVVPPATGRLCNGLAPVTAPANPGGVDHTIDAGVYLPPSTPPTQPPSTTPPAPPTSPGPSAPPVSPGPVQAQPPAQQPLAQAPAQAQPGRGSLASTGIPFLPMLLALGAALLAGGTGLLFAHRRRRVRRR